MSQLPPEIVPDRRAVHREGSRQASSFTPLEVLAVDDDESSRELVAAVVRQIGHRCVTAVDGNDALRLVAQRPVDVIISDWGMPGMNGSELCRRTRSLGDDAPYTYFILMTAFDDRAHLFAGMAAGADDYQRKPMKHDELEARLMTAGRVVEHHRRLASHTKKLRDDSTRLFQASRTDALTGAGNRLSLDEEIETLLARAHRYGRKCSLAICDLDLFKSYNDHFGHVAGDEALRRVAGAMRASLRSADSLFRYGGEEFVALLLEQRLDAAECAMERVRGAVEALGMPSPATGGSLTLSVGVAEIDPGADRTSDDWLRRADEALYVAKSSGRNRVVSTMPPAV